MKHFLALSALLAASAVLTECGSLKRHSGTGPVVVTQSPNSYWICYENLEVKCVQPNLSPHKDHFQSETAAASYLSNRTSLEVFAADIQTAADCVDAEIASSGCSKDGDQWAALRVMADYLDSSAHLDILQAAGSTPCLQNTSTAEAAGMSLLQCYFSFMEHIQQDMCQALTSLEACSVTAVSSGCGEAAGDFIQSVWDFAEDPEVHRKILAMADMSEISGMVSNCQQQAHLVKRFAKRALETLRK